MAELFEDPTVNDVVEALVFLMFDALDGVALMREHMRLNGREIANEYAAEEWDRVPQQLADMVHTLIHVTYHDRGDLDAQSQPWRKYVLTKLEAYLLRCSPIRIIK